MGGGEKRQLENDTKQMGLGIKRKINIPGYFSISHLRTTTKTAGLEHYLGYVLMELHRHFKKRLQALLQLSTLYNNPTST